MNPIKENIIKDLGLESLSEEEREVRLSQVGLLIYQNVLMRIMETMSDENIDEFEKLLDKNAGPSEVFTFLKNKVEDFEKIVSAESEKFRIHTNTIMDKIGV